MVVDILKAIFLWVVIFVPGGIVGGFVSKIVSQDRKILSGVVSQVLFIVLSLSVILSFNNGPVLFGLQLDSCCVLRAILYSGVLAGIITLASVFLFRGYSYEPPFLPRSIFEFILVALLLAPFSEELMYRGVVEGYLLSHAGLLVSILVPAILFSLMHIVPYSTAPRPVLATVILGAFLLGVLAGYYRALSNSIIPAYASHSTMNAVGFLQYHMEKRIYLDKPKITHRQ